MEAWWGFVPALEAWRAAGSQGKAPAPRRSGLVCPKASRGVIVPDSAQGGSNLFDLEGVEDAEWKIPNHEATGREVLE